MGLINCLVAVIKISSFVFNRRKLIALEQLEGEKIMTEFTFSLNYNFNYTK